MAYVRKTRDEFHIQQDFGYGHGWETVCIETTWTECRDRKREYRQNQPEYLVRSIKKRVKLED
jgi:hypothetical protein